MGPKPPSGGGRSAPWRGRPAITLREADVLKGDRDNGAEATVWRRPKCPMAR